MGWWSTGVLGGDVALDAVAAYEKILDLEHLYPLSRIADRGVVRERVQTRQDQLADEAGADEIAWQVLGALAAAVGASLEGQHVARIRASAENDTWAKEDPLRAQDMAELLWALDRLEQGETTELSDVGLLQALSGR